MKGGSGQNYMVKELRLSLGLITLRRQLWLEKAVLCTMSINQNFSYAIIMIMLLTMGLALVQCACAYFRCTLDLLPHIQYFSFVLRYNIHFGFASEHLLFACAFRNPVCQLIIDLRLNIKLDSYDHRCTPTLMKMGSKLLLLNFFHCEPLTMSQKSRALDKFSTWCVSPTFHHLVKRPKLLRVLEMMSSEAPKPCRGCQCPHYLEMEVSA